MYVSFDNLPDSSKIWIYQSSREFNEEELKEIDEKLKDFVDNWKRHGDDLKASYSIRYNQFIILAVDESYNNVSGCSVDASTHIFKQIESDYNVDLFNRLNTAFKYNEHVNVVTLPDFQKYVKQEKINKDTIVFNNLVKTKEELQTNWEVAAENSWHSRFF